MGSGGRRPLKWAAKKSWRRATTRRFCARTRAARRPSCPFRRATSWPSSSKGGTGSSLGRAGPSRRSSSTSTCARRSPRTSASATRRFGRTRSRGTCRTPSSRSWGRCAEFVPRAGQLIARYDPMDRLVSASLLLRRVVRQGRGVALALAFGACLVLGAGTPFGAPVLGVAALWGWRLASRLRRKITRTGEAPFVLDLELGMLLVVGLDAALLRFEGGLSGTFSPAVYALVALV